MEGVCFRSCVDLATMCVTGPYPALTGQCIKWLKLLMSLSNIYDWKLLNSLRNLPFLVRKLEPFPFPSGNWWEWLCLLLWFNCSSWGIGRKRESKACVSQHSPITPPIFILGKCSVCVMNLTKLKVPTNLTSDCIPSLTKFNFIVNVLNSILCIFLYIEGYQKLLVRAVIFDFFMQF